MTPDRAGAEWLEDRRTPTWNTLTHYGSMLSDTLVKVILVAVVGGAMVLIWRRWHDGVFLALAVSLEATIFVISSFIVDRDRPPVEQVDPSSVRQLPIRPHRRRRGLLRGAVRGRLLAHLQSVRAGDLRVIAVAAPLIVGVSQVWRGMHHLLDVVAGILLGLAALYVVRGALAKGADEIDRQDPSAPERGPATGPPPQEHT